MDHTTVRNPLLVDRGIRSLLGVPLLVGGNVIGVPAQAGRSVV